MWAVEADTVDGEAEDDEDIPFCDERSWSAELATLDLAVGLTAEVLSSSGFLLSGL